MKKFIGLVLLLGITFGLFAIGYWENDGIPIRQGVNIEWTRASVVMDDGSIVYVWSDTRDGDRDIFGQKIDAEGNPVWGENSNYPGYPDMIEGVKINGEINRQEDIVAINVGDGNIIVAWIDFRADGNGDVYAQKLNTNGEIMWDEAGVPLCLVTGTQISLNIVNDANGGIYLIWYDTRNPGGTDIYGTHINGDGNLVDGWSVDGDPIVDASGSQNQHTFWEDGAGGAIMAWHDERDPDNENIYIQRILSNGNMAWGENGIMLTDTAGTQEKPKVAPDTDGNFIFAWIDKSVDVAFGNLRAMKVDLDGNHVWANETIIYAGDGVQRNPRLTSNDTGGVFVAWEDGRNDFAFIDIYAQKINSDGTLAWNADGVEISLNENNQFNPRNVQDGEGGCWIIWDDGRLLGHPHEDIYVQHINAAGEILYEVGGQCVCNAVRSQFSPLMKKNTEGNYVVTWGDNRSGSIGIYMQLLDENGVEQFEENGRVLYFGLSGDAKDYTIQKNGDNPIITWSDTRNASISQIYMQVMNHDGTFQFVNNGTPLTNMTNFDQDEISITFDEENEILAASWKEIRSDFNQIYAQAVDLNGNSLWNVDGLLLAGNNSEQSNPKISLAEDGSFYIGWSDFRENWDFGIMAQRVVDGVLQWDAAGITISDESGDEVLDVVIDNYFIWTGGAWGDSDILMHRIGADGTPATGWNDSGLVVCGASGNQNNAKAIEVDQGILVVWDDLRNGDLDIYGQIVTPEGDILWGADGVALSDSINDQALANVKFSNDDIYAVWADLRDGQWAIYMQSYDMNGAEQWIEGGFCFAPSENVQQSPYIVGNDEYNVVFWEEIEGEGEDAESNLFAQLLNTAGEIQWSANGEIISAGIRNQNMPLGVTNGEDKCYVIWEDTRSSGKTDIYNVYAQKIILDPIPVGSPDISVPQNPGILNQNYPNPFNPSTTISYNLPGGTYEDFKISIYNIKGQLVNSLKAEPNSVIWNGRNMQGISVSSGIYFYRLESETVKTSPKKMILLK